MTKRKKQISTRRNNCRYEGSTSTRAGGGSGAPGGAEEAGAWNGTPTAANASRGRYMESLKQKGRSLTAHLKEDEGGSATILNRHPEGRRLALILILPERKQLYETCRG